MLVELVLRLGHDFDWWLTQPLAFLMWCYFHLQEIDRRRQWEMQMSQIDQAWLNAKGFHEPNTLKDEQVRVLEEASGVDLTEQAYQRGLEMLADLEAGDVFNGEAEVLEYVG